MPLTIRDAENAAYSAAMDIETWVEEFVREWTKPLAAIMQAQTVEQVIMMFETMPMEMRDVIKQRQPEQYEQIMKAVNDLKARKK